MSQSLRRTWRTAALGAAALLLAGLALSFPGCSAQDETLGTGQAELVFRNQGDTSIPITVTWSEGGYIRTQDFTVFTLGRVTLRVSPQLSYDIEMRPDCAGTAAAGADRRPEQNQVLDLR